ncbi:GGDEF domain-containing protein [Agrobacterium cavarae]|uniref:GGDEF domain-containing protein n=1 Tax=Agrobacterium cavarae TaxID=2528239 RepID=UPI0028AB3B8B|nr:GGDEF domain-containing protein [Agrobacterium cavarae]
MTLDYASIHFCNALLNANYAAILFFLWFRRREDCLLLWGSSFLTLALSTAMMSVVDHSLAIALLFGCISANVSLLWAGTRAFDGGRPFVWEMAAVPAGISVLHAALAATASLQTANAVATALLAVNVAFAAHYFFTGHGGQSNPGRRISAWALLAYLPIYAASTVLSLSGTDNHASAIVILVSDLVLNNAFMVGLVAMMEGKARQALRVLADTDPLTGALNRSGFFKRCEERSPDAVLVVDLDHFKDVNDTFGHAAGDAVLRAFHERIRTAIGDGEYIGRIGGEEFAIVLTSSGSLDVGGRAEKIRNLVCDTPVVFEGRSIRVTASIGVATASKAEPIAETLRRADEAMYRAKRTGRNKVAA